MDSVVEPIVWYAVFVFSVTLHEAAHAWVAQRGGDSTAALAGQVSLDPVPHMRREPFGMVMLPILSLAMMGWPLGYASAPYDPRWADRFPRRAAVMALAGPASNLLLVLVCTGIIWLGISSGLLEAPARANFTHIVSSTNGGGGEAAAFLLSVMFSLNLLLFVFNLIPVPPLDGAGAITLLLSDEMGVRLREFQSRPGFGMVGLLIAWYAFGSIFDPIFTLALNLLYPGANYH